MQPFTNVISPIGNVQKWLFPFWKQPPYHQEPGKCPRNTAQPGAVK